MYILKKMYAAGYCKNVCNKINYISVESIVTFTDIQSNYLLGRIAYIFSLRISKQF